MKTKHLLPQGLFNFVLLTMILAGAGCATSSPNPRLVFPNASINGKPLQAQLDTGWAMAASLDGAAAQSAGVPFTPYPVASDAAPAEGLSDAASITLGAESQKAQFVVDDHAGFDLIIGWPVVRDNILVFDGTQRTVSAATTLPTETAGWLKLKLDPTAKGRLSLEIPLDDGTTSTLWLNTGDPGGVYLPMTEWKKWRSAHPLAHVSTERQVQDYTHSTMPVARDGEIKLGPLALTDVPVAGSRLIWPRDGEPVAVLGLEALARMDMVVDAKNGVAYVHPHSSPESQMAGKQNWTVGQVPLKTSAFALPVAKYGIVTRDYDGAIADCNRSLEIEPGNAGALLHRASAEIGKQDFAAAIADCDRVLQSDPQNEDAADLRALARESQRDPGAARAEASLTVAPAMKDQDPSLWKAVTAVYPALRTIKDAKKGDLDAAIHDLDVLIKKLPASSSLYAMRGILYEENGDLDHAFGDFNLTLELDPRSAAAYSGRAVAWEIRGDFEHALSDFDHANSSPRSDDGIVDGRLDAELLRRRLHRPSPDFARTVDRWPDDWWKSLGEYIAGKMEEADLLAVAEKADSRERDSGRKSDAFYYIGMMRLLNGDRSGAAAFFQKCVSGDANNMHDTTLLARAELARLNAAAPK